MKIFQRNFAFGLVLLTISMPYASVSAQVPPPQPGKADPDTVIAARQEMTAAAKKHIVGSTKGPNLQPVTNFVRSAWRKMDRSNNVDAATASQIEDLDIDAVANALATLGYTNADLRKASGSPKDLVLAAQNVVLGRPSLVDMVTLAPEVIVGELVGVEFDAAPGDGFGSTAKFRVENSIKGGLATGTLISVRQRSGSQPGDYLLSNEFIPSSTGKYVMFLSSSAYGVRGHAKDNVGLFSRVMLPYRIEGDNMIATESGQETGKTLQELLAL